MHTCRYIFLHKEVIFTPLRTVAFKLYAVEMEQFTQTPDELRVYNWPWCSERVVFMVKAINIFDAAANEKLTFPISSKKFQLQWKSRRDVCRKFDWIAVVRYSSDVWYVCIGTVVWINLLFVQRLDRNKNNESCVNNKSTHALGFT